VGQLSARARRAALHFLIALNDSVRFCSRSTTTRLRITAAKTTKYRTRMCDRVLLVSSHQQVAPRSLETYVTFRVLSWVGNAGAITTAVLIYGLNQPNWPEPLVDMVNPTQVSPPEAIAYVENSRGFAAVVNGNGTSFNNTSDFWVLGFPGTQQSLIALVTSQLVLCCSERCSVLSLHKFRHHRSPAL
jgi:hypothetical protein